MQLLQLLPTRRAAHRLPARRRRRTCARAAASPPRSSRRCPSPTTPPPPAPRRARGRRLGLLEPRRSRPPSTPDAIVIAAACARPSPPSGELERGAERGPDRDLPGRPARGRGGGSRPGAASAAVAIAAHRHPRRLAPSSCSAGRPEMELRLLAPLSRADEHLRRPRQHPLPAAALRVARASASPTPAPGPGEAVRPRRPRPLLHRRRPGPRPAHGRRRHGRDASARRSPPRSTTAPSLLAVCGGYQLLGHSYQLGEETLPGLGLADLETVREPGPRLIGNVAIEVDLGDRPTAPRRLREPRRAHLPRRRRPSRSAGCSKGTATTAATASRASAAHNLIGTYLHGPLLPKNAWLADHLIALALARRYGARARARAARRRASRRRPTPAPARGRRLVVRRQMRCVHWRRRPPRRRTQRT